MEYALLNLIYYKSPENYLEISIIAKIVNDAIEETIKCYINDNFLVAILNMNYQKFN